MVDNVLNHEQKYHYHETGSASTRKTPTFYPFNENFKYLYIRVGIFVNMSLFRSTSDYITIEKETNNWNISNDDDIVFDLIFFFLSNTAAFVFPPTLCEHK